MRCSFSGREKANSDCAQYFLFLYWLFSAAAGRHDTMSVIKGAPDIEKCHEAGNQSNIEEEEKRFKHCQRHNGTRPSSQKLKFALPRNALLALISLY